MHNLTRYQQRLIARLVESGRFANKSEVVRAGLRLLEEHERSVTQEASLKMASGAGDKTRYPLARSKQTAPKDSPGVPVEGDKRAKR